jgi:cytochrome c-type biogenesis protein
VTTISLSLCFLAGVFSFFSPCVISIVPAYISVLAGKKTSTDPNRSTVGAAVIKGLFFITGFSLIFVLLGLSASMIGGFLVNYKDFLSKIGGLIIIVFGLHLTGVININFLNYDYRINKAINATNYGSVLLMGMLFSIGWSPCIGPILGSILTSIAVSKLSILQGGGYLALYSLGLAIPFVAAAFGVGWVEGILHRYKKVTAYIQVASGVIIIISGVLLFFGIFERLNQLGAFINFG